MEATRTVAAGGPTDWPSITDLLFGLLDVPLALVLVGACLGLAMLAVLLVGFAERVETEAPPPPAEPLPGPVEHRLQAAEHAHALAPHDHGHAVASAGETHAAPRRPFGHRGT